MNPSNNFVSVMVIFLSFFLRISFVFFRILSSCLYQASDFRRCLFGFFSSDFSSKYDDFLSGFLPDFLRDFYKNFVSFSFDFLVFYYVNST